MQAVDQVSVIHLIREFIQKNKRQILSDVVFSNDIEKPYGRKVLFQNDAIELLLTGWNPGHSCWPHTHGREADGIVFVLSGKGTFNTFPEVGKFDLTKTSVMAEGDVIYVPQGEIHSMGNSESEQKLVCLHAYWPPIAEMWIYNPEQTISWHVSDGGAWKPEQQYILEERKIKNES